MAATRQLLQLPINWKSSNEHFLVELRQYIFHND